MKRTGPVSTEVDCATLTAKAAEDALLMSYVGSFDDSLFEAFVEAAKQPSINEKYQFVHTSDESCADAVGVSAPGVSVSRRFDDSPVAYSGEAKKDDIVSWAKSSAVPKLITFSEDYIEPIFADHNPALILFTQDSGSAYQGVFSQAANDLNG